MASTIRSGLFFIQFLFLGAFCTLLSQSADAYLIRIGERWVLKANSDKGVIEIHELIQSSTAHQIIQIEPLQESDFKTSGANGLIFTPSYNNNTIVLSSNSHNVLLEIIDNDTEPNAQGFGFGDLLTHMLENDVPTVLTTYLTEGQHHFPAFNISNALSDREFGIAYSDVITQKSRTVVRVQDYPPVIGRYYLDSDERPVRMIYQMQADSTTLQYRTYFAPPDLFNDRRLHRVDNYVQIRITYLTEEQAMVLFENRAHSKGKTNLLKSFKNLFTKSATDNVLQNNPPDHDEPVVPFSGYMAKIYLKAITESYFKLCFLLMLTSKKAAVQ